MTSGLNKNYLTDLNTDLCSIDQIYASNPIYGKYNILGFIIFFINVYNVFLQFDHYSKYSMYILPVVHIRIYSTRNTNL